MLREMDAAKIVGALVSGLDAAEASPPVDAVEAVTRELGDALGALNVSFLIADLSGRALVRLAHVVLTPEDGPGSATPLGAGERRADEESATVLPFDGGPAEQTVRSQQIRVVAPERSTPGRPGRGSCWPR